MKKIFKNIKYENYYKDILPYVRKDKNQQYFAIILTLSASIFFALFAINPTLSTITKLRKEVSDNKQTETQLSQKIQNLSTLSQSYQDIQNDIPFLLDAIPNQPEAPILIAQIQSLAQDNNVSISNIIVSPMNFVIPNATTSSSLSFDISAKSNYSDMDKFLSNLTEMQRLVSINSFSLTKSSDSNEVSIEMKGSAFFKK